MVEEIIFDNRLSGGRRTVAKSRRNVLSPALAAFGFDLALVVPIFYLALLAVLAATLERNYAIHFFVDDAFFYIKTAAHASRGEGFTFDGFNETNGYQLLYMWVLVGVGKVAALESIGGLRTLMILHGLFVVGATWAVNYAMRPYLKLQWRAVLCTMIAAATMFTDVGTEGSLLLFAFALYVAAVLALHRKTETKSPTALLQITVALAATAVCLSRLDAVLLPLACAFVMGLALERSGASRRSALIFIAASVAPVLLVVVGGFVFNSITTGHFLTISAFLKSDFPNVTDNSWLMHKSLSTKVRFFVPLLLALTVAAVTALRLLFDKPGKYPPSAFVLSLNLYVIGYLGTLFLFAASEGSVGIGSVQSWYFTLPLAVASFDVVLIASATVEKFASLRLLARFGPRRLVWSAASAMVIGVLSMSSIYLYEQRLQPQSFDGDLALADWIHDNLPPDSRIFMIDLSGRVGFASERSVVAGDGLINSWDYWTAVKEGRVQQWMSANRVDYIVTDSYQTKIVPGADPAEDHATLDLKLRATPVTRISVPVSQALYGTSPVYIFPVSTARFETLGTSEAP